jgi:hypothetical protein
MMALIFPGQPADDDLNQGIAYVSGEMRKGRTGLFVGKGPGGFLLLVGSLRRVETAGGTVLAVSLDPAQLSVLRDRIMLLLHGEKTATRIAKGTS